MLTFLKVEDFALIESAEVEFENGFNALTGETGAGKTVLVGAIGMLLGERADSMQVRRGAEQASFSCEFDLSGLPVVAGALADAGYLEPGETELLLGRKVSSRGKSRCTVNGRIAPVSALAEIGDALVDIHGQNTHQSLLRTGTHVDYLDRFAGGAHMETLADYRVHYAGLNALLKEMESLSGGAGAGVREAELIAYEVEEIEKIDPRPGEIEALEQEARKLRNARELLESGARSRNALTGDVSAGGARELLLQAERDLRRMASHDGGLEPLAARAESAAFEVEDLVSGLDGYLELLGSDPVRLEEVETRLSTLRRLSGKHGGSLEAAIAYMKEAGAKLVALDAGRLRLEAMAGEIEGERAEVARLALKLTDARHRAAADLSLAVRSELADLELSGAGFEVGIRAYGGGAVEEETGAVSSYGPGGADYVEFLFSPEPKEPPRPLKRIASGGEMSRVMLALKIVLAGADRIPVLVFDEVDAGIGGETAVRVGEKLKRLTLHHQVFCVTHIPQIASCADWQYRVFKSSDNEIVRTGIELLDEDGRVEEMCRMLGDSSGRRVTREHARALLERAGSTGSRNGVR